MKPLEVACACLMVAATSAAQNLLTNGSFNGNLNGWGYSTDTSYDATLNAAGTSGSGSAKVLVPPDDQEEALGQCVAITGSARYKAGGKIFIPDVQASGNGGRFGVYFYSTGDCSLTSSGRLWSAFTQTAGSWTAVDTGFVTSPSDARSAKLWVEADNYSAVAFQINFDDIFLIAEAAAYGRWLPAVSHKDVQSKNARWRSDVAILNRSTSTANLTITMHLGLGPVSQTVQLAGSSQLLQTDVAGWLGVTNDSGPLEVTSDQDFFLSGRTYNQVDATHTYGQDYEGQESSELLAAGDAAFSTAWLPQLTENASYRTNIGIANTGTTTANVTVTGYDGSGNQVWSDTRDYLAGGFYQYQQPYLAYGGIANGYAKVTVNSGSGVVAYASVVDANTADPTTITMKR